MYKAYEKRVEKLEAIKRSQLGDQEFLTRYIKRYQDSIKMMKKNHCHSSSSTSSLEFFILLHFLLHMYLSI